MCCSALFTNACAYNVHLKGSKRKDFAGPCAQNAVQRGYCGHELVNQFPDEIKNIYIFICSIAQSFVHVFLAVACTVSGACRRCRVASVNASCCVHGWPYWQHDSWVHLGFQRVYVLSLKLNRCNMSHTAQEVSICSALNMWKCSHTTALCSAFNRKVCP